VSDVEREVAERAALAEIIRNHMNGQLGDPWGTYEAAERYYASLARELHDCGVRPARAEISATEAVRLSREALERAEAERTALADDESTMGSTPSESHSDKLARLLAAAVEIAEELGGQDAVITWVSEQYDLHGADKCADHHECPPVMCEHEDEPVDMDELRELARAVHQYGGPLMHDVGGYATCGSEVCQRFARMLGERT
jgi:hypothetical protein